ncbi:MAG: hydroxymethylglutaryl-CoA reductase, degradative [Deltaproteobacteria bacterium]|nr:MAG: hydroxymethylglutaryl-CoA reductase, degradative [Deltaproteobacteria bacterium]
MTSRIPGFYREPLPRRLALLAERRQLSPDALALLRAGGGLPVDVADRMSENVIACHGLPLGVALNFRINQRDYIVPMAVEEPSVIAAASNAARLVRLSGGFTGDADAPVMTTQVQFDDVPDADRAADRVLAHRDAIVQTANAAIPRMVARGGGCVDLDVRVLDPIAGVVVIQLYVHVGDAMGANIVDTVAEAVAPRLHELVGGRVGLRILSNLPLRRRVRVAAEVSADVLGGDAIADGIARASRFAELDPLRAATHNKGIMNGIDAAAVALGQDWRSIEAGAHAYAALDGRYRPLARWRRTPDGVAGALEMPLAVGTVGGATGVHPGVRAALELVGAADSRELAVVIAAAGLASNLAALRALAGEGIQRGHMKLHNRRLEAAADQRRHRS